MFAHSPKVVATGTVEVGEAVAEAALEADANKRLDIKEINPSLEACMDAGNIDSAVLPGRNVEIPLPASFARKAEDLE